MTLLPLLITKAAKNLIHKVREITYNDMARQASDWIPEQVRIEPAVSKSRPIKLDFAVPKKNRLAWTSRAIHQRPH